MIGGTSWLEGLCEETRIWMRKENGSIEYRWEVLGVLGGGGADQSANEAPGSCGKHSGEAWKCDLG